MIKAERELVMPPEAKSLLFKHFKRTLEWRSISSEGIGHTLFRARGEESGWVVRFKGQRPTAPGVDRHRESSILKQVQPFNWAPKVALDLPESDLLLMADAGDPLIKGGIQTIHKEAITLAINALHGITQAPLLDYTALFEAYRGAFIPTAPELCSVVDRCQSLLQQLPDIGQCLVHHDLHCANLLWSEGLTLIDWEYAGLGTPWFDFAALYSEVGFSLTELGGFQRLSSLPPSELKRGLEGALLLVKNLETIWHHYLQLPALGERNVEDSRINKSAE